MTQPATQPKASLYFNLGLPLAFFLGVLAFLPLGRLFQIDFDEGINLMKAVLYAQGFPLYAQIWSDQPPLYTVFLSHWLHAFGPSILMMRLLTLIFATVLVGAFSQIIHKFLGARIAIVSVILLSASFGFLGMSAAVMVGLPAMALAMVSIYCWFLYQEKARLWLVVLSGICFGLSLQIKMFTLFLAPLLLLQLWFADQGGGRSRGQRLYVCLIWIGLAASVAVGVGLVFNALAVEQLVEAHFNREVQQAFPEEKSYLDVIGMFLLDLDYVLLAILGTVALVRQRRWPELLPLAWLGTVTIALFRHKPIWWHHQLLISIPLTWLAAYGVQVAFKVFQQPHWRSRFKVSNFRQPSLSLLAAACLGFSALVLPVKLGYLQWVIQARLQETPRQLEIVGRLQTYQDETRWLFTDLPIYGFYANLNVPPEIAVFSGKRLKSGNLTIEALQAVLETYQPEQILLGRFPEVRTQLSDYINTHYSQIHEQDGVVHYVSNRLR